MLQTVRNKFTELHNDPHLREVARGALIALAVRVSGSALAFAFNVAVARLLGAKGTGLYFLALSIVTIGAVIASVGLNNALLRLVASHAAHHEWGKIRAVHSMGIRLITITAGGLSLTGFFLAPWIAHTWFDKPMLAEPLRWMSLSILPISILNLQAQSLKGLKHIRNAMLLQVVGVPLASLVLIWPLARVASLQGVTWAYLTATILVFLLGSWAWRHAIHGKDSEEHKFPFENLWKICKPLFVVALTGEAVLPFAPILLLGIWTNASEVGVFAAANRLAALMSFLLTAANNVIAPKFAELYAKKDMAALAKVARHSAAFNTALTLPLFILLVFFGREAMSIFGEEFRGGAVILAILAVGQFINLATGSVGYLLMMSGNEITFRNLTIASALLLVLLLIGMVPVWGGVGAAYASAISVVFLNLAAVYFSKKKIGINIWSLPGRDSKNKLEP